MTRHGILPGFWVQNTVATQTTDVELHLKLRLEVYGVKSARYRVPLDRSANMGNLDWYCF